MNKVSVAFLGAAASIAFATPASATVCAVTDISPTALACSGFFDGNLLNSNGANITAQKAALANLGFTWDGNFNNVEKIDSLGGSHEVDFTTLLKGISYVAFHFGNGQGGPGNATAFYKLDAGVGLDKILLAYNASSNAVLYSTSAGAVPEPATWAMMLVGFGAIGTVARRKRNVRVSFA